MLGKALYRRNRKKVEKVIPGSQTFSSNGTFVVPYETALYSITIVASARASGRGGDGGDGGGEIDFPSMSVYAGGGGGGGGGTSNNFRVSTNTFSLTKGQSISITCNYSLFLLVPIFLSLQEPPQEMALTVNMEAALQEMEVLERARIQLVLL